jgi:hypothetical protein
VKHFENNREDAIAVSNATLTKRNWSRLQIRPDRPKNLESIFNFQIRPSHKYY